MRKGEVPSVLEKCLAIKASPQEKLVAINSRYAASSWARACTTATAIALLGSGGDPLKIVVD